MGLLVSVYRNAELTGDCTMNGVSKRYTSLCIINADGPFDPSDDAPAAKIVMNPGGTAVIKAVEDINSEKWTMFGGNFAYTSDSRFAEAVANIVGKRIYAAIPIHDRIEGCR
jgi:hypothetical protein